MKRIFLIVSFFLSLCLTSLAQQVIPLYEGTIPGEIPAKNEESEKNGIYLAVSKPDLTIYLPLKIKILEGRLFAFVRVETTAQFVPLQDMILPTK
jgi:hypothetical protein